VRISFGRSVGLGSESGLTANLPTRTVIVGGGQDGALTALHRAFVSTSTAAAVASWQERRHLPEISGISSPLRFEEGSDSVTICIFHGVFSTPTPPATGGEAPPPHDTLRLLVTQSGEVILDAAGYEGTMDPETPSDWAGPRT
jgi:hypothetical protein